MAAARANGMRFFFGENDWASQWYPCGFVERDEKMGVETRYKCAEQYMMAKKALLFGDRQTHAKIMAAKTPRAQKALGRKVKNFDADVWEAKSMDIVTQGNMLKFSQNPTLLQELMDTDDDELVEASPYDKIWGIGLAADDRRAKNKAQWKGENRLGQCLMRVREALRQSVMQVLSEPREDRNDARTGVPGGAPFDAQDGAKSDVRD